MVGVDYTNKGQFSAVYETDGRLIEVWARWHMNEVTIAILYEGKTTDILLIILNNTIDTDNKEITNTVKFHSFGFYLIGVWLCG